MSLEPPYTPKNPPVEETIPFNGADFKTFTWKVPEGVDYKGKILYVHGFVETSTLLLEAFDRFSSAGYEVFFFSQRGAPETSPGPLFGDSDDYHTFNDLEHFIKLNLDSRKDTTEKLYLLGHSMGGGVLFEYGIRGKQLDNIRGIALSAPLTVLHPKTTPGALLYYPARALSKILPRFKFNTKLHIEYFTHSQEWREYITKSTPKLIGTLKYLDDFMSRGSNLLKKEHASKFNSKIPLFVAHGTSDYLNDIEGTKKFFSLIGEDVEKQLFPVEGALHCLFIETPEYSEPVYESFIKFFNTH